MAKKTSTPYDAPELKYTEWWASGELKEWIDNVCKAKGLRYYAHIERAVERKRPDILIFQEPKKPVCVIEIKPPSWDPLTINLVKETFFKADRIKTPYFATWNINKLVFFNTSEFDKTRSLREGIIQIYEVAHVSELKDIGETEHKVKIKVFLEKFLEELVLLYEGKKVAPKIPIDEYFVNHLRLTVDALTNTYRETITEEAAKNMLFKKKIAEWFNEQVWSFSGSKEDYTKIARQAAYLLINKVLFYTAMQEKFDLNPLEVPQNLKTGDFLEGMLKLYFGRILKIDYETVFTTEFIDEIAFPEDNRAVESIRDLIVEINKHRISTIGYDFLGRLFEDLIPEGERHKLGQYFTSSDVVDFILKFCMKTERDFILDPGCGAGTFLVRAYTHKQTKNKLLAHDYLLSTLWGIDISKFASHLTTINLAIRNLAVLENYPRTIHSDFFDLSPDKLYFEKPKKIDKITGYVEREVEKAPRFDCIVGNPPYTRQEEIGDLSAGGYKDGLIAKALTLNLVDEVVRIKHELSKKVEELKKEHEGEYNKILHTHFGTTDARAIKDEYFGELKLKYDELEDELREDYKQKILEKVKKRFKKEAKLTELSKRAGIHAYFFVHGYKFLKDGGRFGFVVSNSWLDVDWGSGLQEFFLTHYRIMAIIESKVERWFVDADVNTCIVILERSDKAEERDENVVRFVQLKKPLRHFIPKAEKDWDKEVKRLQEIDKLVKLILAHSDYYENEEIKIYPKIQADLWKEGYDGDPQKYTGAKWGKYIRAPEIFFKIMERGKDLFVPLKEVADVRFGIKTGANEFFYLTEEEIKAWEIEEEFWCHKEGGKWVPNYVIKSPRECKGVVVNPEDLKYRVLMIHKDKKELEGTNVLRYIEYGESKGFHERPTCKSRKRWYDLGEREPGTILFAMIQAYRHIVFYNPFKVYPDHNLFEILADEKNSILIATFLSSTITMLTKEFYGRSYGGGSGPLKAEGTDIEKFPFLIPSKISNEQRKRMSEKFEIFADNFLEDTFSELNASSPDEVSLDKVKPDRRELDKVVFEILGLTEEEQLEVYKAVVDLVKSRIEKAKSVSRGNKNKKKYSEVDLLVKRTLDSLGGKDIIKNFFDSMGEYEELILPRFRKEAKIEKTLTGWQLTDGKERVFFDDKKQAEYCGILVFMGMEKVKIPKEMNEEKVNAVQNIVDSVFQAINATLDTITDKKTRDVVKSLVIGGIISRTNETGIFV